jgi:dCTP diphosphatase
VGWLVLGNVLAVLAATALAFTGGGNPILVTGLCALAGLVLGLAQGVRYAKKPRRTTSVHGKPLGRGARQPAAPPAQRHSAGTPHETLTQIGAPEPLQADQIRQSYWVSRKADSGPAPSVAHNQSHAPSAQRRSYWVSDGLPAVQPPSPRMPGALSLTDLQARIRAFPGEQDREQFHNPKDLAMALSVQISELLRIFQRLTPEQSWSILQEEPRSSQVRDEVAGVLACLVQLNDMLGIDLEAVLPARIGMEVLQQSCDSHATQAAKANSAQLNCKIPKS